MSRKNLIIDNPFNTTTPFKGLIPQPPFRCVQTTNKLVSSQKFLSVTLSRDDPHPTSFRSEVNRPSDSTAFKEKLIRWYAMRYYFPLLYKPDPSPEVIYQQHEYSGSASPHFALWTMADCFWIAINGKPVYNMGGIPKNAWVPFVFRVIWATGDSGLIQIWKNNIKLTKEYKGKNMPVGPFCPYLKFGIYKWEWEKAPKHSNSKIRNLYVDQVRIGNEFATYEDVKPDTV